MALFNLARMTVSTTGTNTITLNAAVSGFLTFDGALCSTAATGQLVNYAINDTNASEIGSATYFSSSKILGISPWAGGTARTPDISTAGVATPINMTAAAQVFITPKAGDFPYIVSPQGRLTLTTGTPVMTATTSGQTTVYYTPYIGSVVPVFDGQVFVNTIFTEMSQVTTDATKSPAAVGASSVYDLFVWLDTTVSPYVLRCTRGPAWSTPTTRGYTLTYQNGILLNTSLITNGPAALRGTYVGTIASNASSQIDWIYGTVANPPVAAYFGVWNAYNRIRVTGVTGDTSATWTNNTGAFRAVNGRTTNRTTIVRGLDLDSVDANYASGAVPAASGGFGHCGVGLDATNTAAQSVGQAYNANVAAVGSTVIGKYSGYPGLGVHFFQAVELNTGGACNFYGAISGNIVASLLTVSVFM
jgi:hypothetical protein